VLVSADTIVRRALEVTDVLETLNPVESLEDAIDHDPIGNGHSATTPRSVPPEGSDRAVL
jgi:hypothetical protein